MQNIADEIIEDLTIELQIDEGDQFNDVLLASKVKSAIREVKNARRYPIGYGEERINADLDRYYSNIRSIALYDYNMVGKEYSETVREDANSQTYVDRNKLFSGILPFAK